MIVPDRQSRRNRAERRARPPAACRDGIRPRRTRIRKLDADPPAEDEVPAASAGGRRAGRRRREGGCSRPWIRVSGFGVRVPGIKGFSTPYPRPEPLDPVFSLFPSAARALPRFREVHRRHHLDRLDRPAPSCRPGRRSQHQPLGKHPPSPEVTTASPPFTSSVRCTYFRRESRSPPALEDPLGAASLDEGVDVAVVVRHEQDLGVIPRGLDDRPTTPPAKSRQAVLHAVAGPPLIRIVRKGEEPSLPRPARRSWGRRCCPRGRAPF